MPDLPASHEPELLTITEAAELLRAPVATLRYRRHLGTGPSSFRLGRRVLYRSADLRSWIDVQADRMDHTQLAIRFRRIASRKIADPPVTGEGQTDVTTAPEAATEEGDRSGVDREEA